MFGFNLGALLTRTWFWQYRTNYYEGITIRGGGLSEISESFMQTHNKLKPSFTRTEMSASLNTFLKGKQVMNQGSSLRFGLEGVLISPVLNREWGNGSL